MSKKKAPEITNQSRTSLQTKPFGTQTDHPTIIPMISTSPSIDLPLVALIIKVSSATCNAYNHRLSSQYLSKKL